MNRETLTTLLNKCVLYASDDSPKTITFLTNAINEAQRQVFAELEDWNTEKNVCAFTRTNRQYYHLPPDCMRVENVKVTLPDSTLAIPLQPIDSTEKWNGLNFTPINTVGYPTWYFIRKRELGIWPTPQANDGIISINYTYMPTNMEYADESGVGASVTNESQFVDVAGATFNPTYINRWYSSPVSGGGDGQAYRIIGVMSPTRIMIETMYHGGSNPSAGWTIGQSPDVPPEATDLLCWYAIGQYYAGLREDSSQGALWMNRYWTGDMNNSSRDPSRPYGGLLGIKRMYSSKTRRAIVRRAYRNGMWGSGLPVSNIGWPFTLQP